MRAIAGRQMRGLPQGARLDCVDNSGAKTVEIVTVLNYKGCLLYTSDAADE